VEPFVQRETFNRKRRRKITAKRGSELAALSARKKRIEDAIKGALQGVRDGGG